MLLDYDKTKFLYLASPYTHDDPKVRQWRYEQAVAAAALLATQYGVFTFSPIGHSHEMCIKHEMPYTFEFWDDWNRAMIRGSAGILVLTLEGWEQSKGIAAELRHAIEMRKPVDYFGWLHKYDPLPQ